MDILKFIISFIPAAVRGIIIILLCGLLSGCYTEFDPDIRQPEVLCLNSEIIAGSPVEVRVTHTWRYTDEPINEYNDDMAVTDAEVSLYVNGCEYEQLQPTEREIMQYGYPYVYHYYQGTYCPKAGDELRIVAVSERYGSAEGETRVPAAPVIEKTEWKLGSPKINNHTLQCTLDVHIYLHDVADTKDYYMSGYDIVNPSVPGEPIFFPDTAEWITPYMYGILSCYTLDYSHEPIFSEYMSAFEMINGSIGYTMFSDVQFSGSTYPLHIIFTLEHYIESNDIEELWHSVMHLKISSLSLSYYNHLMTLWQFDEGIAGMLGEVGLGTPVHGYSNVSTRAGIVAAGNISDIALDLGDALKEMWGQTQK